MENGRISRVCLAETDCAGAEKPGSVNCDCALSAENDAVLDAKGCYLIPGLIDIHFHGCMGEDFCDGTQQAIRTLAEYEVKNGITAICPATLTLSPEQLCRVLAEGAAFAERQRKEKENGPERMHPGKAGALQENPDGAAMYWSGAASADLVGINMEGPFISPVKKGAQNPDFILPCDERLCDEFLQAGKGLVKIIGLAPEESENAIEYIRSVCGKVRVSLAHTNADYDTAMAAFKAGASHAVHLFNAMPEFTHRAPGVVGAVMDSPDVTAELICDGNHVHPSAVRGAFRMMGPERMVLISDSLRATGLGDGIIDLGGQQVRVEGTRAVLVKEGNLAGSVTNLYDCMRIAVKEMGISLPDAVRCASYNPAKVIGQEKIRGSLEEGKIADALLVDTETLKLKSVIKDGLIVS